jgi:cellobiose phosphorylase
VKPFSHRPGHEQAPPPEHFRSDDALWLFNAVPTYVAETGEVDFYKKTLPYADHGQATVLGHLRRALEFNLERSGKNGLPCGLAADWNDCCNLGYTGESVMVAFQVRYGLGLYAEIAERLGIRDEANWALGEREKLDKSIKKITWDGEWFIWRRARTAPYSARRRWTRARCTSTRKPGPSSAAPRRPSRRSSR